MTAHEQGPNANPTGSFTAKIGLTSLSAAAGAMILVIHSFLGHAVEDKILATQPMEGAALSALHAAIPARADERESPPTF